MDVNDLLKNPDKLKKVLREAIWYNDRKLAEALIPLVKNPHLTYLYASEIIKGKIKDEWEDIIAQNEVYSFHYAKNILKGKFEKGEEVISKSTEYSFHYAQNILKSRFEEGEESIIKDNYYLKNYVEFLKQIGRLDEFLKDHPKIKLEN